jgi:hypothetical protein
VIFSLFWRGEEFVIKFFTILRCGVMKGMGFKKKLMKRVGHSGQ